MHISVPSTALVALLLASIAVRTAAAEAVGDVVAALAPPGHQAYQEAVARSRWHGHDDGRQAPLRAQPLRRDSRRSETEPTVAKTSHQCDLEGLVAQQGEALVAHIRAIDFDCISELFNRAPARVRLAAFQETNMVVVARAALTMVTAYDGFNHMPSLANLLYYLQAGVYVEFYQDTDELRWSSAVDEAKVAVIDAFVASSHFYNDNEATGIVAQRVFPLMDARGLRLQYLAAIWDWLSRWTPIRAESYAQRNAASAAFVLVFASHFEQGFTAAVTDLTPMVLRDFALGDWMVGTDAEGLAANGARELARFLAHPDLPFYDEVRAGVRQVFDHYEPLGHGARIWVAGATSALHYTDCSEYGICEQVAGLESAVLSVEHRCSTGVHIRGQDLDERQIADACATLRQLEAIFHRRLKTGRQPVADDFTTHYEAVAFADYDNYATYSPLFFGNATNNGGLYLEGDPSQSGNVSRHLGYVADWLPDQPIWNLAHEYVHHLDGRFNLKGPFAEYRVGTHKTVWWIEGLAEYLSRREDNEDAVALAGSGPLPLDEIFETTYDDGVERIYQWSYLAIRFIFERQPSEVDQLLSFLRDGDYDGYLRRINADVGTRNEDAWRSWLPAAETLRYRDVASLPLFVPRALSTFDGEAARAVVDVGRRQGTSHALTVSAVSSDPTVATVATSGTKLTVIAVAIGEATIRVTISDPWGVAVRRFDLAVTNECPRWLCPTFASGWRMANVASPAEQP